MFGKSIKIMEILLMNGS